MQSYWGIDHGDVISKKAPADRWYGTRDSSYNSRKENVKGGAAGGALGVGGVAGAAGAIGGRRVGRAQGSIDMQFGHGGKHLTNAAKAKRIASAGRKGGVKGALGLGVLGAAGGAAYGSALGAIMPHKDSRGSAARRRLFDTAYQNKQAYKQKKKAAQSRYWRDLSKS